MRYYSTTAGEMVLQLALSPTDATMSVDTTAGLPATFPYTMILDYGTVAEEVVDVTAAAGTTLTIVRGRDGTVAQAHAFGAKVRHGMTARDLRESRDHEVATSAHGVTTVIGADETQTLDNKTFYPATGNHAAVRVRTKTANTIGALEVSNEAGSVVSRWLETGIEMLSGSTLLARLRWGGSPAADKSILDIRVGNDVHAIVGSVVAGASARFLRLVSGTTELFSVASNGFLNAAGASFSNDVTTNGDLSVTGSVSAATLASSGDTQVSGMLNVTGDTTGPLASTVSLHTAGLSALGTRVSAIETNLGPQSTFAATSSSKDKKRIHWGQVVVGAGDSSGYRTITHGAGFSPTVVVATLGDGFRLGVDVFTPTTFRLQVINTDGSGNLGWTGTLNYFCGE